MLSARSKPIRRILCRRNESVSSSRVSSQQSAVRMKDFRDLLVWDRAHKFTLSVYSATSLFPKEELYGHTSQLRRSALSIPTNIAEGCGKSSTADFGRYLQIAFGSANETEYHFLLARDLEIITESVYSGLQSDLVETKKMLAALIRKVRTDG